MLLLLLELCLPVVGLHVDLLCGELWEELLVNRLVIGPLRYQSLLQHALHLRRPSLVLHDAQRAVLLQVVREVGFALLTASALHVSCHRIPVHSSILPDAPLHGLHQGAFFFLTPVHIPHLGMKWKCISC